MRGLATAFSFESTNLPGFYLIHDDSKRIRIAKFENKSAFRKSASFYFRKGYAQDTSFSFESTVFRNFFIRHRNYELWLDKFDNSDLMKKDATFAIFKGFYQLPNVAQN